MERFFVVPSLIDTNSLFFIIHLGPWQCHFFRASVSRDLSGISSCELDEEGLFDFSGT